MATTSGNSGLKILQSRGVRFALFFFVFGAIPILVGLAILIHANETGEADFRKQSITDLERFRAELVRAIDPIVFVQARLKKFSRIVRRQGFSRDDLRRIWPKAKDNWGFVFEPCWFDRKGEIVTPVEIPLKSRFVYRKLWDLLFLEREKTAGLYSREKKKFQTLFGPNLLIGRLREQSDWVTSFFLNGKRGAIYWSRFSPHHRAGFLGVVWDLPSSYELLRRAAQTRSFQSLEFLDAKGEIFPRQSRTRPDLTGVELDRRFTLFGHKYERNSGRLWTPFNCSGKSFFLGLDDAPPDFSFRRFLLNLLAGLLLVILGGFWFRWIFLEKHFFVPIGARLIGIFLAAMGFPLIGFAFLAMQTLDDHSQVMSDRVVRQAKELLSQLDAELQSETRTFLNSCREIRDNPAWKNDRKKIISELSKITRSQKFLHFEVRGLNGEIVHHFSDAEFQEGYSGFLDGVAKIMIQRYLAMRLTQENTSILTPLDPATQGIMENPSAGMSQVFRTRNSIFSARFGGNAFFLFYDLFPTPSHPLAYIAVTQSQQVAVRDFLTRRLTGDSARSGEFTLLARDNATGRWFPRKPHDISGVEALLDKADLTGQAVQDQVRVNQKPMIAVAIPGFHLLDHSLVAIYPKVLIQQEIRSIQRWFVGFALLVFLFALGIGSALSRSFLLPVMELKKGLEALGRQDTSCRISIIQPDEMGLLVTTFNQVLDDLKELGLAQIIQEALIPDKAPPIPGYEGHIFYRVAERLSGDYCDIQPIPDGRWLVVIGDVTGHGVGSALMMTMVKAAVIDHLMRGMDLSELFRELNVLIAEVFQRRMLMTFFAAILNPATGEVEYLNAGHPFPLQVLTGGGHCEIAMPQMPLGLISRKNRFEPARFRLEPGECVILFTDGLYEAVDQTNEMFGYQGFINVIERKSFGTMSELCRQIWNAVVGFQGNDKLMDDATMVLLRRNHE
jgi:serine phosphatase RsbU (regulator of sigma subunit)